MVTETITYTDFKGVERKETHYFNLSETELTKLNLSKSGGLEEYLTRMAEKLDGPAMAGFYEFLIDASYGVMSEDGRKLVKNKEVLDDFKFSGAYDVFYMTLLENGATKGIEFFTNVVPEKFRAQMAKNVAEAKTNN